VSDAAGNGTSIGYDLLGRKVSLADPDMGAVELRLRRRGQLGVAGGRAGSGRQPDLPGLRRA